MDILGSLQRIKKLKIVTRFNVLIVFVSGAFLLSSGYFLYNFHKLQKSNSYVQNEQRRLTKIVDLARTVQVDFKKQVQEWKNILLRGHNAADYDKYLNQFKNQEQLVLTGLDKLIQDFKMLKLDTSIPEESKRQISELGKVYRQALYDANLNVKIEAFDVDSLVRGIDRVPTDYMDRSVSFAIEASEKIASEYIANSNDMFLSAMLLSVFTAMVTLLVLVGLLRQATDSVKVPVDEIIELCARISQRDFSAKISAERHDEFGEILKALAKMQVQLDNNQKEIIKNQESLAESYRKVSSLKDKQDGDYFLMSLLSTPLQSFQLDSDTFIGESLLCQKKSFSFKGRDYTIGGDVNIAKQIMLNERVYNAVVNGDAMGKSMQGAGGALVFGSVFQAILARTNMAKGDKYMNPEKWIRNTFFELQRVFESFDCTMLFSLVFGLLDEATGTFYYIVAEHPLPVLYRDGKASFLGASNQLNKLGTPLHNKSIIIDTIMLEPGDKVFIGSDGRDDVLVPDETGSANMNEDENLFLRLVENANGDFQGTYDQIKSAGDISDDFSLICLERPRGFQETSSEAEEKRILNKFNDFLTAGNMPEARAFLTSSIQKYEDSALLVDAYASFAIREKLHELAYELCKKLTLIDPAQEKHLYNCSLAAYSARRLSEAASFGERYLLRKPNDSVAVFHLFDVYLKMKNYSRAREIFGYLPKEAKASEPGLKRAKQLPPEIVVKKEAVSISLDG